jgi:hypothetical protein
MGVRQAPGEPVQPEQQFSIEDLVPAFTLGVADAGEAAAVLRQAADPRVNSELAAYGRLAERLLYAAPAVQPPLALGARLQAALGAERAAGAAGGMKAAESPADAAGDAAGAAPPRVWHWPLWAAAAAVGLLLLLNLYWLREIGQLRAGHAALEEQLRTQSVQFTAQLAAQEQTIAAQQERLGNQDQMLASLVAEAGERYAMHAVAPDSAAVAQVAWLADSNTAILRAENFPILEEGKEYQLWLISGDQRTSGGLFTVDDYGCATVVFHPSGSLDDFDGMGITPEPAGGSPGPTAAPVVRAQL